MSRRKKRNNEEEKNEDLTLSEKIELENKIMDVAFRNSFSLITREKSFDEILEIKEKGMQGLLAHDPSDEDNPDVIENMMSYFEENEEYEKCAVLRDILNK